MMPEPLDAHEEEAALWQIVHDYYDDKWPCIHGPVCSCWRGEAYDA